MKFWLNLVAHDFKPSIQETEMRRLLEFEANLSSITNAKSAWGSYQNPVSMTRKQHREQETALPRSYCDCHQRDIRKQCP